MCGPHQVWPLRSECCGRGVPTKVVCAECMKMCCLGGKNSVVKGLNNTTMNKRTSPSWHFKHWHRLLFKITRCDAIHHFWGNKTS